MRLAVLVVLLASCGRPRPVSRPAAPPAPTAVSTTPATPEPELTCEEACTEIGACYEEATGEVYHGGGWCVTSCEEKTDEERRTFFTCVRDSSCEAVSGC